MRKAVGRGRPPGKQAIFHTMTGERAVTKTEEKVTGLEKQIAQKPRE